VTSSTALKTAICYGKNKCVAKIIIENPKKIKKEIWYEEMNYNP